MNEQTVIFIVIAAYVYLILAFISVVTKKPNKPYNDATLSMDKDALTKALLKYVSSSDEQILGILAQNAECYLETGSTKRGFCFITNKACYFIGNVYQRKGLFLFKKNIQHRIINSELKGIKVDTVSRFIDVIYACVPFILSALGVYNFIFLDYYNIYIENDELLEIAAILGLLVLLPIFIFAIYFLLQIFVFKRIFVCMEFANITIAFPIYTVGELEAKEFYRVISKVQDHERKREISNIPDRSPQQIPATPLSATQDKIGSLKELSTLYAQKLINEQEYNSLKKQLLQDTDSSASADTQESETSHTQ